MKLRWKIAIGALVVFYLHHAIILGERAWYVLGWH